MEDLIIVDKIKLESKVKKIKADGFSKLHFVTDFDRTLTTVYSDNQTPSTSWATFTGVLNKSYITERQELFDMYRPIEINTSLDTSYRLDQMEIWWKKHLDLLIKYNVSKNTLKDITSSTKLNLRKGLSDLFDFINKYKIPCLIFSAGIGDLIIELLNSKNITVSENIHIVSNFFSYDNHDDIAGFQGKIIHSLNKDESAIHPLKFHTSIENRPNCILLGDTLEDVHMLDGLKHDTVIKIGFLNDDIDLLEQFKTLYDVIITGRQSPIYLSEILKLN